MTTDIDPQIILNLYLFGREEAPDFNDRVRSSDVIASNATSVELSNEFALIESRGRYAWLSRSNFVEHFFNFNLELPFGEYSVAQLENLLFDLHGIETTRGNNPGEADDFLYQSTTMVLMLIVPTTPNGCGCLGEVQLS